MQLVYQKNQRLPRGEKMMRFIILMCFLSGCTMFRKTDNSSNEMVQLTEDVLKKDQGVEIDVKPIPKTCKK